MELGWSNSHIQISFEVILIQQSCLSSKLLTPLLDPLENALERVPASSGFLPKVGHFVDAISQRLTNLQGQYSKAKEKKLRVPQVMGQFT